MNNCPHCGAEVFKHDKTRYCISCGKDMNINTCKSTFCVINKEQIVLPNHAEYCPVCGKATTNQLEIDF